ncbi:MAG: excinuclease ABC subunit UvrC [Prevotellaceae bacterium]|jgi:excinuclease ABC subunit C|nr:excinuclease ABC subunit UvrC [Prevotellaceae bacterium]
MQNRENESVKSKIRLLPNGPGIYQFFDISGTIIYVGKAKNLRKRVSSYFLAKADNNMKLKVMVKKIADIRHIITQSESDALLLENNMIKKHQPRYNVLLKDDKTYPWICVTDEHFPRIFLTRKKSKSTSKYFGPYTSVATVKMLLDLIKHIYPLRDCRLNLSPESIAHNRHSVCLEYHIGNCKGPCTGRQPEDEYMESIAQAINIIKGNTGEVIKALTLKMNKAAKDWNFEEAQSVKEKLQQLENYQSRSVIINPTINDIDVFSLICDKNVAYSNFMRVVNGSVVQVHTLELKLGIEEEREALLSMVIAEMTQRLEFLSYELIVPFKPDIMLNNKIYTVPSKGDKLALLRLSEKNVKAYRMEKLKHLEKVDPEKHINRILNVIKSDLCLPKLPRRIECFDNSNIQGSNPVAACVVFINAKPAKKEYRHFNVKTVEGPDDFASMQEIVYRRYLRVLNEKTPLPQLIVIDGGKGQLSAAVRSLKRLKLFGKIPVLGLAKRLEEIYFPDDNIPLHLNKNSETLKVLMQIRDEAHRFGITFHRDKRSSAFITSELEGIKGIGKATAKKLMTKFKTVSAIKKASMEELSAVTGKHLADLVYRHFNIKTEV